MKAPYSEPAYQQAIIGKLEAAGYSNWKAVYSAAEEMRAAKRVHYDPQRAVMPTEFTEFVRLGQPEEWKRLEGTHGSDLGKRLVEALVAALDEHGVVHVLRRGIQVSGRAVAVMGVRPTDRGTPEQLRLHAANRFAVVEELKYDPWQVVDSDGDHRNRLDLVLFLNGIPLITAELKNQLTGQTVANAIEQFQNTRRATAPIFMFPRRTVQHFVVDKRRAFMTSRLNGVHTRWFPFDRGWQDGRGNPPEAEGGGKSGVEHLWEDAWRPDSVLELVERYVVLQPSEETDPKWTPRQHLENSVLKVPRYHQRRAVNRMVGESRKVGPGRHFLVQHSTGSGKSLTLAWLAHRLKDIHGDDGKRIYDKVIVISDRQVVVSQLQALLPALSFDNAADTVVAITDSSPRLSQALGGTVPIIVCTLHKFFYVDEQLTSTIGKNYAIIIDEAHSSQHGDLSEALVTLLRDVARSPTKNLSFFAFTGTPKDITLQTFGEQHGEQWVPFDLYSMKQAREEDFIVDTLQHYVSWRQEMNSSTVAPGETNVRGTTNDVFELMSNDPAAIKRKCAIIAQHYLDVVHGQLGGAAKAMVVANGREAARCYLEELRAEFQRLGREEVKLLVAFSGPLVDDPLANTKIDEARLNGGIGGEDIPKRLRKDHHILVVANKFQVGFDEPRLAAMYLDKSVGSINAVQTLSRLNRPYKGKGEGGFWPVVVDFYNDPEKVYAAFREYDTSRDVKYYAPPELLGLIADELDRAGVYTEADAEREYELVKSPAATSAERDAILLRCMDAFDALPSDDDRAVFRHHLLRFLALFCSVVHLADRTADEMHRLRTRRALYVSLRPEMEAWRPGGGTPAVSITKNHVSLNDDAYRLICMGKMPPPTFSPGGAGGAPRGIDVGAPAEVSSQTLQEVVDAFNARFGIAATGNVVSLAQERIVEATHRSPKLASAAKKSGLLEYRRLYRDELTVVLEQVQDDPILGEFADRLLNEMDGVAEAAVDRVAAISFDTHRAA
jgi:type I restriction enzyme R subunit